MEKTYLKFSIFAILFIIGFAINPTVSRAATIYFSPSSGTYNLGNIFSVAVYVSSTNQAMNTSSGIISFPKDKLEVISLSKTGSIFTLWVQEPTFSNTLGTINFEGIVLNPGFTGADGKILTVNFRVKAAGVSALNFSSGSVLANDGQGTNILTSLGSARFSLIRTTPTVPETTIPPETIGTLVTPQISSPTHPDPNKWYAINDAKLTWRLSPDVTAARLLFGRNPQNIPTVHHEPAIDSRELFDLADGIWYFHVRLRNSAGWGNISHFRFQIDTKKPSYFEIRKVERDDKTDPKVKFVFDAKDETSGIDYYEIQINNQHQQVWRDIGNSIFETPALGPGKHIITAKAFDKAGNFLASFVEFEIQAIEAPVITEYPKQLLSGESLVIRGTTKYPNAQIIVWIERKDEEAKSQTIRSDNRGNFTFVAEEKLKDGIYKIWAEMIDKRGARSASSEKITISVDQPAFLKIGSWAISLLAILVPLVALVLFLIFLLWFGWHKFSSFKKRVTKETDDVKKSLHQAFKDLKRETAEQVAKLDDNPDLSEREKEICDNLKKALNISEKLIDKEIKDITKEIKKQ